MAQQYPAVISLGDLSGADGFELYATLTGEQAGIEVHAAGDINGDGFADIIVGAASNSPSNVSLAGSAYVVFGSDQGFSPSLNLDALDGTNGFRVDGAATQDKLGTSVFGAGDLNGDGIDDFIVGAPYADPGANSGSGSAYVIYGKTTGFDPTISVANLTAATGFRIDGVASDDSLGFSVASAGDINGDGVGDIIVGARGADPDGIVDSGASYVIFGTQLPFPSSFNLTNLNGANGFRLDGASTGDTAGFHVESAGDVNGDGIDDLIIGAPSANPGAVKDIGTAYVVFGKTSAFAASMDLNTLNGTNGFRLTGHNMTDYAGFRVTSMGDINGDGFADVGVSSPFPPSGTYKGVTYVVYGKGTAFAATTDLTTMAATSGFKIEGQIAGQASGIDISTAGDVNGDGLDDMIVSSASATAHGASQAGLVYVIFGKTTGFGTSFDVSTLNGTNGFRLEGVASKDYAGVSVSSAGDMNGDGFDDLLIGAGGASPYGVSKAGVSYVVFGKAPTTAVTRNGTIADQHLAGGALNDQLNGLGGDDKLFGNAGADKLDGGTGADTLIGGAGNDIYTIDNLGDIVIEKIGGGTLDRINSSVNFVLGAGIEIEALSVGTTTAKTALSLIGNEFAQTLYGNDGINRLNGGGGADTLIGYGGNDIYTVDDAGDKIIEAAGKGTDVVFTSVSYALAAGVEVETLQTSSVIGTDALVLTGNSYAQTIIGNYGNDTIDGGGGADTMRGYDGDDKYYIDNPLDVIIEASTGGTDTAYTTVSYTLAASAAIETLSVFSLTGTGAINLIGNGIAQTLFGNDGTNKLDGGAGADKMYGNGGNDSFYVDNAGDKVVEVSGDGNDTVFASTTYTLGSGVYVETLSAALVTATNALNLTGNALDQTVIGNDGANILGGGAGTDILQGRGGNDGFLFNTALGATNIDTIKDFGHVAGNDDTIRLENGIFTTLHTLGTLSSSAFVANATGTATTTDQHIVYNTATGALYYDSNGSTAGGSTEFAVLTSHPALTASDFVVI